MKYQKSRTKENKSRKNTSIEVTQNLLEFSEKTISILKIYKK